MKILMISLMMLAVAASVSLCGCCGCCGSGPINNYGLSPTDTQSHNQTDTQSQNLTDTQTYQSSTHAQNGDWTELCHKSKTLDEGMMRGERLNVSGSPFTVKIDVSSDKPVTFMIMDDSNFQTYYEEVLNDDTLTVDYLVIKKDVTSGTFKYKFDETGI